MLCRELQDYISTAKGLPFFYIVGDSEYLSVLHELQQAGIATIRMSDFCPKDDKYPSIDELVDYFRTSDVDFRQNKFVVTGLGEYLALRGTSITKKELLRLKNTTLGNARAILLLRGVSIQATNVIRDDNKMSAQKRAYISKELTTDISIINIPEHIDFVVKPGIRELLNKLEDGQTGSITVSTKLNLDNSTFPVTALTGAYAVLSNLEKGLQIEEGCGKEEQWQRLLNDVKKCDKSLKAVFEKNNINERIADDLYLAVSGHEYWNWLVFLYLKLHVTQMHESYLKRVVEETYDSEELKTNLLLKIIDISPEDPDFKRLYVERKKLVKAFPEEDISVFVKANEIDPEESIYRLTDNTLLERKTIVRWVSSHGMNEAISYVYPALDAYLKKYIFNCPVLSDELTEYFDEYKHLKVANQISDHFIQCMEKYASMMVYAQLPTRDNAIKAVADKEHAYLYWIDALGVEYLSYIAMLAKKKGLSINIDIARSDLPTITSINKKFYEQWAGGKKYKEEQLDNIKHKDKGGYFFTDDESPIHIPAELAVIERAISTASMELGLHNCKSFVIASDHGASRLAVLKKQEVPYDTDTKGEHSGRCCKIFEGCDVPYRIEENGYIVLSDYGRFRGSRSANMEVHGGATLEEIVVPVITLTLKKKAGTKITVLNPENIVADRRSGVSLSLYISDVESPYNISLIIGDMRYKGKSEDGSHYNFELKDIKRSKNKPYEGEVFEGENLLGGISFKVKGKMATIKSDFDFDEDF